MNLDEAFSEAAKHRAEFLRLHREACIALCSYCEAMGKAQELSSKLHQPGLGGNVEAENKLAALLIRETPVAIAKRSGLESWRGWGCDRNCDLVPLVKVA